MNSKKWYLSSTQHIGKSHIVDNIPCQDSTHTLYKNGVYVSSLSDGCSSKDLSHFGSKIICEAVCELLSTEFDELYNLNNSGAAKIKIVDYLGNAVKSEAEKQGVKELERYSATLVFAAVKGNQVITGRFGDGTLGLVKDGKLKIFLYEKKPGEVEATNYLIGFYPGVASQLTSVFDIKKTTSDNITGFVMMSDGSEYNLISKPYRKGHWSFASVFKKLFNDQVIKGDSFQNSLEDLMNIVTEKCPKADDCSIAVMSREDVGLIEIEPLIVEVPDLPPLEEISMPTLSNPTKVSLNQSTSSGISYSIYLNKPNIVEYLNILEKNDFFSNILTKDKFTELLKWMFNKEFTMSELSSGTMTELNILYSFISNLIELDMVNIDTTKQKQVVYKLI